MSDDSSELAMGTTLFAAVTMMIVGALDALEGLAAIIKGDAYVVGAQYLYKFNVSSWGWINLLLGLVILAAGFGLLSGALWARILGIFIAVLVIISNFMWLPYYPVWSIIIIAVSILVIWSLTAHGRDMKA
jgi:hypothetical protein